MNQSRGSRFSAVVSTPDYNGIQLPALVTAPLLSGTKMQGCGVERRPRGQLKE